MRLFLLICTVLATGQIKAQYQDYIWLLGQNSQTDIEHAGMTLDFFDDTLSIHSEFRDTYFFQVNTSISDPEGNIILSTNGLRVYNHLNEVMENGDTLNPGYFFELYQDRGYILEQGAIALAQPESDSIYFVFHMDVDVNQDFTDAYSNHLYVTEVHPYYNNQLGKVVAKNQVLIDERMDKGKITAVKSANGRDWWILAKDYGSNLYHKLFFTTDGEITLNTQEVGDSIPSGSIGQAVFSPDGTKYVQLNLHGYQGDPIYINIYDFDRCSGELYNPIQFTYADSAVCLGAANLPQLPLSLRLLLAARVPV